MLTLSMSSDGGGRRIRRCRLCGVLGAGTVHACVIYGRALAPPGRTRHRSRRYFGAVRSSRGQTVWKCTHSSHRREQEAQACGDRAVRTLEYGTADGAKALRPTLVTLAGSTRRRGVPTSELRRPHKLPRHLIAAYGGRCFYCGTSSDRLVREHVVPLAAGGPYELDNWVPACSTCNSRKGPKSVAEFMKVLGRDHPWAVEYLTSEHPDPQVQTVAGKTLEVAQIVLATGIPQRLGRFRKVDRKTVHFTAKAITGVRSRSGRGFFGYKPVVLIPDGVLDASR